MKLANSQLISITGKDNEMTEVVIRFTVNGKDLTNATHEETVNAFNIAEEPIVVEVLRRANSFTTGDSKKTAMTQTIGTQTEPTLGCCCRRVFSLPEPPPFISSLEESRATGLSTSNLEISDYDKSYQIEYEEVLLHKTSSLDRIGLTLCYGPADKDGVTEIYIGDVEANSLAGRDGRIQQGDQIIKINDCEVKNRQEAIQLFSENRSEICLLISRPAEYHQMDDGFSDDFADSYSGPPSIQEIGTMPLILEEVTDNEDNSTITDTATLPSQKEKDGKDSGVGHDSAHSSEQECEFSHYDTICTVEESDLDEIFGKQCMSFRQILEDKCQNLNDTSMEQLCEELENFHQTGDFHRSVPKMGTRLIQHGEKSLPRSESQDTAYNTAESCKSVTSTLELTKTLSGSTLSITGNKKNISKSEQAREKKKSRKSDKLVKPEIQMSNSDIAYTTEDRLAETMIAQQKVLLEQSKTTTGALTKVSTNNNNNTCGNTTDSSNMEWVVKRRADGTRYITRRPIRSKVLSARKKKLEDERCGMTTDDDTMSELKTGRHWSKEERRCHFQKAKEYQQRKLLMHQKIELLKKVAQEGQTNIIELSQKKMQKKAIRDFDFITVPELLAHRGKFSMTSCNILSVTTV